MSVKKLLHYQAGGLLHYRAFLLHYRALITVLGVFYYIIGHVLHYRVIITLSVGTECTKNWKHIIFLFDPSGSLMCFLWQILTCVK